MTKTAYTNVTAIAKSIELLADCGDKDLLEKLVHMLTVAEKPAKKASGMTKAQIQNMNLATQLAQFIWEKGIEGMESKDLIKACGIAEITSTQKASHLLKKASEQGWVVRQEVKSKVLWGMGEVDPR